MNKKFLLGVMLSVLSIFLFAQSAFAMTFQQPASIGKIGFPVQAPYRGLIVDGATYNDGTPYRENRGVTTYTNGTARFGEGTNALWCRYNFSEENNDDCFVKFGGANDFVLTQDISYREIFQIDNDAGRSLYAIYHTYCVTDLKILGVRNGKWFVFIDSKKISDEYFDGKDGYKLDGGVLYDVPTCSGDTIIVTYRRWHWSTGDGVSEPEGEFRFKWNDKTQRFGVKQIIY